jgi:hypothetical protein
MSRLICAGVQVSRRRCIAACRECRHGSLILVNLESTGQLTAKDMTLIQNSRMRLCSQTSHVTHACPPAPQGDGPERHTTNQRTEATITQQLPQLHNRSSHVCKKLRWYGIRKGGSEGRLPRRVR